jgi:ATP-dependent helicase/nuclease subunit B
MILSKEKIKTVDVSRIIAESISSGSLKELLIVVPTNRKLRGYKKELISLNKGKGITALNLETFESLCERILDESKIYTIISEAASSVLLSQSVDESELKYFSSYKGEIPHGTLNRIRSVISEYKRHGFTPDDLRKESKELPNAERLKANDIADIYERYRDKTSALSAYEAGDIYSGILNLPRDEFEADFKTVFPDVKQIFIRGFDEFSEPEINIIDLLSSLKECRLWIEFDYSAGNRELFAHLDKCHKKLEERGFKRNDTGKQKEEFADIIREKLFSEIRTKRIAGFKDKIYTITAFNREEEVINIAKEVKRLILKEGVEPYKICVAFNLVQNYSPVVNEVFSIYGIPLNMTDRVFLEYTAPIITLLNLLEILENDYYFRNVIRAFSSSIISKEGIELKSIINSAVELKIIGGLENWTSVLKNAIEERMRYKGDNEFEEEEVKTFKTALESINKIQAILKPFEGKLTIGGFLEKMESTVYELDMPQHILDLSADKEKELKALTTFLETMKEVFNLLLMQYGAEKTFDITFFLNQIRTAAGHARFNVKEKSDSAVLVTSLEEIRGLEFDYLFIGGLCDGDFPTRYQPEIFFAASFQKLEEMHLTEERYRFYQALNVWKKKLYLSTPLNEASKELNESSFLKEFGRLFEVTPLTNEYFSNKIFSTEEIQKIIGSVNTATKNDLLLPELMKEHFDGEYFSRAVNVQETRLANDESESIYNGYLNSGIETITPDTKEKIEAQFEIIKNKQYSISQLETYAKCPFKFFIERILTIKPEMEPTEEIEAIEMGNLLHAVFFEFFSFLRDKGIVLNQCSEGEFTLAKKKLFEIARHEIDAMPFASPLSFYEKEKILGVGGDETNSILFKLLMYEKGITDGYEPKYFETPFGNVDKEKSDSTLKDISPVNMNGIKLKGKIDRIEINEKEKFLRIVDYKLSGKKPTKDELWQGLSLQLPVYLAVAEQILYETYNEKLIPLEMVIYSLKFAADELKKDKVKLTVKKDDDEIALTSELLAEAKKYISGYVGSISKGVFHLSKHPNREKIVCRYCGLRPICRVSETN